jgi:hypothetical protein
VTGSGAPVGVAQLVSGKSRRLGLRPSWLIQNGTIADNPGTGLRQAAVRLILEAAGTAERDILPVSQDGVRDVNGIADPRKA